MTKKGVRSVLPVQMVSTLLVFCRSDHALASSTGRFLTKDNYPPDLLAPLTQNTYQYCENNPINRVDPTGRDPVPLCQLWADLGTPADLRTMFNNNELSGRLLLVAFTLTGGGLGAGVEKAVRKTAWREIAAACGGAAGCVFGDALSWVKDQGLPHGLGGPDGTKALLNQKIWDVEHDPLKGGVVADVSICETWFVDESSHNSFRWDVVLKDRDGKVLWSGYWDGLTWAKRAIVVVPDHHGVTP